VSRFCGNTFSTTYDATERCFPASHGQSSAHHQGTKQANNAAEFKPHPPQSGTSSTRRESMGIALHRLSYPDDRISEVRQGAPLTADERADLLDSLPSYEECWQTRAELASFSDALLMTAAVTVWSAYCS
jgi:hypothetical protein